MFNATIEIVLIAFAAFAYWDFVDGLFNRPTPPQPQPEPTEPELTHALQQLGFTTEEIDGTDEPQPTPIAAIPTPAFSTVGAAARDWSNATIADLRRECTARGHRYAHLNGKNRHATRAQMLELIQH